MGEVTKKPTWIKGNEEFKEIFRPFFASKYPPTEEKGTPRDITVISGWRDYPEAFCHNFKKIFYDFTLGPARKYTK